MGKCRTKKDKQTFAEQSQGLPQFFKQKAKDSKPEDFNLVIVYKRDGSKQCGAGKTIPLTQMSRELSSQSIKVVKEEHAHDGRMYIQVCGGPTGYINIYHIYKKDLKKALKLGFKQKDF